MLSKIKTRFYVELDCINDNFKLLNNLVQE